MYGRRLTPAETFARIDAIDINRVRGCRQIFGKSTSCSECLWTCGKPSSN